MKKTLINAVFSILAPALLLAQGTENAREIGHKILDFKPLDGSMLILNQLDNTFYLELDSADQTLAQYPLPLKRPSSIYFDCTNAAYIVASDSSYEFTLAHGKFTVLSAQSRSDFDIYVRPCLASFNDRIMIESFQPIDNGYEISMYFGEETRTVFTRTVDVEISEVSETTGSGVRSDYSNDFQNALRAQNSTESQINSGVYFRNNQSDLVQTPWQPSGVSAVNSSAYRMNNTNFKNNNHRSNQAVVKPLVSSLQLGKFMAVIDRGADSVFVLDHYGYELSAKSFVQPGEWVNVAADPATGEVYVCASEEGENSIYRLDAFTGSMLHVVDLDAEIDVDQLHFYDGRMYFAETDQKGVSISSISMF